MTLKSEQDTPEVKREILDLAVGMLGASASTIEAFFEHDQWWVRVDDLDKSIEEGQTTYSVVDTSDGLDLEELG